MEEKKIPLWQIICTICIIVFIVALSVFSLIFSKERWQLSAELVTLISFIVIICGGFFFDSIQIGKISLLIVYDALKDFFTESIQENKLFAEACAFARHRQKLK